MKLGLAQINPLVGDLFGNGEKILHYCLRTNKENGDIVITPELSLWGYPPKDLLLDKNRLKQQDIVLEKITKELHTKAPDLKVLIGVIETAPDNQLPFLYNSIVLINNGEWKVVARKQLLPTYDVFDEKRYFRPGDSTNTINIEINNQNWKIGLTICEDLWVEEQIQGQRTIGPDPLKQFERINIDILINLSASPFSRTKELMRHKIVAEAASRIKCPVVYLNQVGANDELIFDGASFVMNKHKEIIALLPKCQEHLEVWDTSHKRKEIQRKSSRDEEIFLALILGIKDYCNKCGFKSAVLGLSGGIDSAIVATLATAALGADQVHAILMPSPWSSKGSIVDAISLAERLGIRKKTIPINDLMKNFDTALKDTLGEFPKDLTAENLQSRIRGTLLMAIANQQNHLLLSTGNKSELAMGYCTLYGDMNGGLSVIGDLYKTSVFNLCNWLDSKDSRVCRSEVNLPSNIEIIGEEIRKKAPSAELRKDQLDSDSLPQYDLLDPILKDIMENRLDHDQLIKKGYEKSLIDKIKNSLKKSEFKRKQAPPLLKVSNQAFGSGWRLPIASK